jgi:hypothetical protein
MSPENSGTNSLAIEGSTSLMPMIASVHDQQPLTSTCYSHNVSDTHLNVPFSPPSRSSKWPLLKISERNIFISLPSHWRYPTCLAHTVVVLILGDLYKLGRFLIHNINSPYYTRLRSRYFPRQFVFRPSIFMYFLLQNKLIERRVRAVNIPASRSRGPGLKSWPGTVNPDRGFLWHSSVLG